MNLLICGDFENGPFGFKVEDPKKQLVSDIKSKVSKTINIPERELILYFSDSILPDDTPLSQWKDMRSGAAVLVAIKPLIVTLQRYNSDIDVKLEIPRLAVPRWQMNVLFQFCLYKAGMPYRKDGKYIFMVDGNVLEMGNNLSKYECLQDNFTISVTFVKTITLDDVLPIYIPERTTDSIKKITSFEQARNFSVRRISERDCKRVFPKWHFNIQKIDGSKVTVTLDSDNPALTPVYGLRNQISRCHTNIRLTFGTTVLEDWDDKGNMMLLYNYPDLHDGATLCQINLTGAIGIRFSMRRSPNSADTAIHSHIDEKIESKFPDYICIPDPDHFKVNQLYNVLVKLGMLHRCRIYKDEWGGPRRELIPSNDPISSIDFVIDQCMLYITTIK